MYRPWTLQRAGLPLEAHLLGQFSQYSAATGRKHKTSLVWEYRRRPRGGRDWLGLLHRIFVKHCNVLLLPSEGPSATKMGSFAMMKTMKVLFVVFACAVATSANQTPAFDEARLSGHAEPQGTLHRRSYFYVGGSYALESKKQVRHGQIYVERLTPVHVVRRRFRRLSFWSTRLIRARADAILSTRVRPWERSNGHQLAQHSKRRARMGRFLPVARLRGTFSPKCKEWHH